MGARFVGRSPNKWSSQADVLGALDCVVLAPPSDRGALVLSYVGGDLKQVLGPFSDLEHVNVTPTSLAELA